LRRGYYYDGLLLNPPIDLMDDGSIRTQHASRPTAFLHDRFIDSCGSEFDEASAIPSVVFQLIRLESETCFSQAT
jgi:hypothetical protein